MPTNPQRCADAGICYPPHTQTVLVALNDAVDSPPPVDPRLVEEFAPAGSAPPLPAIAPAPARAQQDTTAELYQDTKDLISKLEKELA